MCFEHAASCVYNDTVGGVCNCMDNTDGINCDTCLPGFFEDGTVLPTDREVCKRTYVAFEYSDFYIINKFLLAY